MRGILFSIPFALACGGADPGFRIDDVSVAPDDVPVDTDSTDPLKVGASIFHDRFEVSDAWVDSEEGALFIPLTQGAFPRWTGSIPLTHLHGFPAGVYFLDFHATDAAGREVVLDDGVRLRIRD
jgi:hypothetical protein